MTLSHGVESQGLAIPLASSHVAAAGRLYAQLEQWVATDRALAALAEQFPDFDLDAVLLKVVTLNALYGTQVYAVFRMAQHVHRTLADGVPALAPAELVERLARLPTAVPGEKARAHLSFASKFAHFFIDAARFPILDSYAERMVALRLGRANRTAGGTRYARFLADLDRLRTAARLDGGPRDLDRYLWLAGQYTAWPHPARRHQHRAPAALHVAIATGRGGAGRAGAVTGDFCRKQPGSDRPWP